jgi:hypothetical protein
VIQAGTVLGGRYLIEGERPADHDGVTSWWALDRQLKRRVAVVVLADGRDPVEMARTTGVDYAGRLLDGGDHEGMNYLVIRADAAPAAATRAQEATALAAPLPTGDATSVQPLPTAPAPGPGSYLPPPPLPPAPNRWPSGPAPSSSAPPGC